MNFLYKYKLQLILFPLLTVLGVVAAIIVNKSGGLSEVVSGDTGEVVFDRRPLPQIDFLEYKNRANHNSDLANGKILLLYIRTACRGCQTESELIAQSGFLKDSDLRVFGIANDDEQAIDEFVKNYKVNFPILADPNGKFREELGITFFPANFLISGGVIEKSWVGAPQTISQLKDKLDAVQGE